MGSEGDVKKDKARKGSVKSALISDYGKKGKREDQRSVHQIRPGPPKIPLPPSPGLAEGADSHSHTRPSLGLFFLNVNLFSCPNIWGEKYGSCSH